jgi:hypothetical protein
METILDAAQTVPGYFGFDRTIYGNKRNATPRKWRWLQEIKDIQKRDKPRSKLVMLIVY